MRTTYTQNTSDDYMKALQHHLHNLQSSITVDKKAFLSLPRLDDTSLMEKRCHSPYCNSSVSMQSVSTTR